MPIGERMNKVPQLIDDEIYQLIAKSFETRGISNNDASMILHFGTDYFEWHEAYIFMYGYAPDYDAYLRSPIWKLKRNYILSQRGNMCESCGRHKRKGKVILQVHHLTYDRIGRELDSDLMLLCKQCHEEIHRTT